MTTTFMNALNAHPWLTSLIIAWIVLILHLPYRVEIRRNRRRVYGVWQSLVYRLEYGPTSWQLEYTGLRQFQRTLLDLLRDAWALLRGDVLRRMVDELRK